MAKLQILLSVHMAVLAMKERLISLGCRQVVQQRFQFLWLNKRVQLIHEFLMPLRRSIISVVKVGEDDFGCEIGGNEGHGRMQVRDDYIKCFHERQQTGVLLNGDSKVRQDELDIL